MTQNATQLLNSYITDMIALEEHLEKAVGAQLDSDDTSATHEPVIRSLHAMSKRNISLLQELQGRRDALDESMVDKMKAGVASALGAGASLVDSLRSESMPKNYRDNYTAVSLTGVAYLMLETTASAFSDMEVRELASTLRDDYAQLQRDLLEVIPPTVLEFLRSEGYEVAPGVTVDVTPTSVAV